MNYLTTVDKEGKLCWKKSGQRITTSTQWKDTPEGIVPVNDDEVPGPTASVEAPPGRKSSAWSEDTISSSDSESAEERADRYVNTNLKAAKGPRKMVHVSPATILNQLLRTSVRKNTWIFVSGISRPWCAYFAHGRNCSSVGFIDRLTVGGRSPTQVLTFTSASSSLDPFSIRPSCTDPVSRPPV